MSRRWRRGGILAAAATLLAACASPPTRPPAPAPAVAPPPAVESSPPPAPAPVAEVEDPSPWARLRRRLAMHGCDYRPEVLRRAQEYAANPRRFAASWRPALPFLLLVLDEIEKRNLPGEFAMLPYVESGYRPLAARGDRSAGMWQLVPDTARGAGLVVADDYDERLDALASTRAALDLIARYEEKFGDWRLANMAFNSGEFRVARLLGERDGDALSADELARLPFNPVTHDHLDRLLALSCIVEAPQRFGVVLPEPRDDDRLQDVAIESPIDLRVAANLAGVDAGDLKRWNAAHGGNRMSAHAPAHLLLPASRVDRFAAASAAIPPTLRRDWHEQRADRHGSIAGWAATVGVPVAVLAAANASAPESTVASSTRLLLPGAEPEPIVRSRPAARTSRGIHVVASGDTLSRIARRYGIALKDLRRWNPRAAGTLHPGDKLRVGVAALAD